MSLFLIYYLLSYCYRLFIPLQSSSGDKVLTFPISKAKKSPQKNQQLTVILRNSIFIGHLGSSDLKVKTFSICLIVKNSNQENISIVSWHGTALNNQVSDFILLILIYGRCSGFGWGGFNFLPSGWYAAMLIIWGCLCYCRGGLAQSQGLF